jgi:hypothetical protein
MSKNVTKSEFFALLYADKRDIMPHHASASLTQWKVVRTGEIWGETTPGWKNPDAPRTYAIRA